jgi:uncharacterized protein
LLVSTAARSSADPDREGKRDGANRWSPGGAHGRSVGLRRSHCDGLSNGSDRRIAMDLKNLDPEKAFLGVGWSFPPQLEVTGTPLLVPYEEDIRQSIMIIMGTEPGERIMRPDFGAGLNRFVFEPLNTTTMALVQTRVHEALVDWEPRIEVVNVKVTTDVNEKSLLLIDTSYRIRATNTLHNLVYPFYLQEATKR